MKNIKIYRTAIVSLTFLITLLNIDTVYAQVSANERQALIDLYNATDGPNWINNTNWNTAAPVSDWFGVTVTDGTITRILINNNNLVGSIPGSLGQLNGLTELFLLSNKINGNIPSEIGQLINLRYLYLGGNSLNGNIPVEIGQLTNLEHLELSNNFLSGGIPPELGQLSNLKTLQLGNNVILKATVPEELGQLVNLEFLGLSNIGLTGKIPSVINTLPNLSSLHIKTNDLVFLDFEDEFDSYKAKMGPNFLYSPQYKSDEYEYPVVAVGKSITLSSNELSSVNNRYQWYKDGIVIPGATSKDLVITNAQDIDKGVYHFIATNTIINDLSIERDPITLDVIPATDACGVSASEKQALIDLYNSTGGANWANRWDLSRPVCDWFGVTVVEGKVTVIVLSINNLIGEIPNTIGQLEHLTQLHLNINQLTGTIPVEIAQLSNLELLRLSANQLTGTIPSELSQLTNLEAIWLDKNQLVGIIPNELGQLTNLGTILLHDNQLMGNIPSGLSDLSNLSSFFVMGNNFVFSDFEQEFNTYVTKLGTNFKYTPQSKVDLSETQSVVSGESITLTSNQLTSSNNQYQWYKDGVILSGATNKDLVITNATDTDAGVYHFTATNTVITGLTLERNPITLEVT
ncbi:leucine-rich repeat domain-containing protein, partial [uncultured Aquimarina sp.]|uniref:leucine-rich repeat domain-containing protein n=1 Tax=uncultured Aquimarina sp. TaxID=575652 RepID=UPI00261785E9